MLSDRMVFPATKSDNSTIFIVYRGVLEETPENTMSSFKKAVEMGANGLMVDVRITKDKKLVLMRDETIDRTTDGKGRVDQLLYDELRLYDAGSWRGKEFKGEKVPLLTELLIFCKVNDLKLIFDVKQFGTEKQILSLVKEKDMIENVYFLGALRNIKTLEPSLPIHNIIFKKTDEILRDTLDFAHAERNHIAVNLINSDSRKLLKKSINKKADIIVLNYPQLIMDIFYEDEPKKVVNPDPMDYLDWHNNRTKSTNEIDTGILRRGKADVEKQIVYTRDELSTLTQIMQNKDASKDEARMAALAITGLLNDDTMSVLIGFLRHKRSFVRLNASWAIGLKSDKNGLKPLVRLLRDEKEEEIKRECILAIKRIASSNKLESNESKEIAEELIKLLKNDTVPDVRYDAARTLGALQDVSSVNQLVESLQNDSAWNVKSACAEALGKIGDKRGVVPLGRVLVNDAKIEAAWTRKRCAWALAEIGEDAIETLIEALSDNERSVRLKASWALIKIGKPSVQMLVLFLKNLDKRVKIKAALALGWIGDDYAIKALKWALKDFDTDVRITAAWALGRIGSKDALDALEATRKDKNFTVRINVIEAINRIKEQNKTD